MDNLVSVVITAYNLEDYLSGAIESVISQTYDNLEIIIVDDGSTDKTPFICDEYLKKDNRIKVIHKENGGVSSARNYALDIIKGDFVCFLDGDDAFKKNYIEIFLNVILEKKCDFVACTYCDCFTVQERNEYTKKNQMLGDIQCYSQVDYLKKFLTHKCSPSSCEKIFDARIVKDVRFLENIKINEDKYFQFQVLMKSTKVAYLDLDMYICLNRKNSASRNNSAYRLDQVIIADHICSDIEHSSLQSVLQYYGKYNACLTLLYSTRTLYRKSLSKKDQNDYYIELKERFLELKKFIFKEMSFKCKFEFFLAFKANLIYKVLIKYVFSKR